MFLSSLSNNSSLFLPLQDDGGLFGVLYGIFSLTFFCVWLLLAIAAIVGMWKIFEKAGEAGWKAIIPIYNIWVLLEIVGRPGWWIILFFIPIVQIIMWILLALDLAKSFDKGVGYAIGIILLPWLFYILLGFSDAQYYGPAAGK